MNKIENDKYYTTPTLAKYIVEKTKEIIGEENITQYVEPSAGSGVFLDFFDREFLAFDIEPEGKNIVEQDWLTVDLDYKKGRCVIGNPPFGTRNTLSVKFYKKAIQICDYIAFILPISQYNNNEQMYEFDLVYSEDLGFRFYTDRNIHCCFNVYKRNSNGLNKPNEWKLKDVEVLEYRRGGTYAKPAHYDFGMCAWGNSVGKKINFVGQYAQENYIIIRNDRYRNSILDLCNNTNWKSLYPYIGSPKIQTWKIYKYLKEQIPELQ